MDTTQEPEVFWRRVLCRFLAQDPQLVAPWALGPPSRLSFVGFPASSSTPRYCCLPFSNFNHTKRASGQEASQIECLLRSSLFHHTSEKPQKPTNKFKPETLHLCGPVEPFPLRLRRRRLRLRCRSRLRLRCRSRLSYIANTAFKAESVRSLSMNSSPPQRFPIHGWLLRCVPRLRPCPSPCHHLFLRKA